MSTVNFVPENIYSIEFNLHTVATNVKTKEQVIMADNSTTSMSRELTMKSWRNCKCKYRLRWFCSKGAFLILVWSTLTSITVSSMVRSFTDLAYWHPFSYWMGLIPGSIAVPALIFSGWLADNRFGKYRVAKFGLRILFIGTLSVSIDTLLLDFLYNQYLTVIFFCVAISLTVIGLACFSLMLIQLGLDQMPNASSSNITSLVAWFTFCMFGGNWIHLVTFSFLIDCIVQIIFRFSALATLSKFGVYFHHYV